MMEIETKTQELVIKRIENLCKKQNRIKNKKMSAYRVSKNGKFNPGTLNNLLSGTRKDPRISTIGKICIGFNMSVREFFDDDLFD